MLKPDDYEVLIGHENYDFPEDVVLFFKRLSVYAEHYDTINMNPTKAIKLLANDKTISYRIRSELKTIVEEHDNGAYYNIQKALANTNLFTGMCANLLNEDLGYEIKNVAKAILNVAAFEKANKQY
jgi:hypothetical protein